MRIRSIKPEFWKSEDISELSWETRFIFIGLWSYVEDEGAGRDNIRLITAELFPLEPDLIEASERVEKAMAELESKGRIVRYEGFSIRHGELQSDRKSLFYVTNWSRHQVVRNPNKPRFTTPTCADGLFEDSTQSLTLGTEVLGTEVVGTEVYPDAAGKRKKTHPHLLPEDWAPSKTHREKAEKLGIDCDALAGRMRQWAFAKDIKRASWNMTFSTFLANEDRNKQSKNSYGYSKPAPLNDSEWEEM